MMNYSSYQIEILVTRFQRLRGLWRSLGRPAGKGDRVHLTEEGQALSRPGALPAAPPPADLRDVRDEEPRPELVEREMERRAGSFLQPPFVPQGAPRKFPKVRYKDPA